MAIRHGVGALKCSRDVVASVLMLFGVIIVSNMTDSTTHTLKYVVVSFWIRTCFDGGIRCSYYCTSLQ